MEAEILPNSWERFAGARRGCRLGLVLNFAAALGSLRRRRALFMRVLSVALTRDWSEDGGVRAGAARLRFPPEKRRR